MADKSTAKTLLALLLLLIGTFATAQEIVVAAAADMSGALPQLVETYTRETGQAVKISFGSSGNLTNQIRNGAPFDVFFSADEEYPKQLIAEGLASRDTLYRYAVGRLVLWVPGDSPLDLSKLGMQALLDEIIAHLPENPPYFPEDQLTDLYERDIAADLIREAALHLLRDEVPHGIAVRIDQYTERGENGAYVEATLLVEKETHKGIVIGQGGSMLKQIGSQARAEIESMSGRKVYLKLHVKVRKNWRNDEQVLKGFGYSKNPG